MLPNQQQIKANLPPGDRYQPPVDIAFADFLLNGNNGDLSNFEAIRLYRKVMPFFNAVHTRAQAFSNIPIRVKNKRTNEFVDDHPALELLAHPNADVTQEEFLVQLSSFYDITGDAFLAVTGMLNRPPIEIATLPPQRFTFRRPNGFSLLFVPRMMVYTDADFGLIEFKQEQNLFGEGEIRFTNKEFGEKECWHIRSFNPLRSFTNFWGMSRAQPALLEMQQFVEGNNNNLSMLARGTRLSMVWINNRDQELTDKQWDRMQEEAQKYAGAQNAGGTPILDGMDAKSFQATNRDMEYSKLQQSMLERISSIFAVPLPLLLSQSMTLNNLETAMFQLYDRSVLPLATTIYSELTRFLMPRYENSEDMVFTYNPNDIEPLRERAIETAKTASQTGIFTDNELREMTGEEELGPEGDVIYKPANLIPIDGSDDDPNLEKTLRRMLEEKVDMAGERVYSDDDIDQLIELQAAA